jgi:hypothetical protein
MQSCLWRGDRRPKRGADKIKIKLNIVEFLLLPIDACRTQRIIACHLIQNIMQQKIIQSWNS